MPHSQTHRKTSTEFGFGGCFSLRQVTNFADFGTERAISQVLLKYAARLYAYRTACGHRDYRDLGCTAIPGFRARQSRCEKYPLREQLEPNRQVDHHVSNGL